MLTRKNALHGGFSNPNFYRGPFGPKGTVIGEINAAPWFLGKLLRRGLERSIPCSIVCVNDNYMYW